MTHRICCILTCALWACTAGGGTLHQLARKHNVDGVTLLADGRLQEARAAFHLALEYNPDFAEPWNNLGIAALREGDEDAAFDFFTRALKFNPDFAEALNNLGVIHLRAGRLDAAVQAFEDALAVDPGYVAARLNLAIALHGLGDAEGAREQLLRVIQVEPESAGAHVALGLLLLEEGDLVRAEESADEAAALDPDAASPWLLLARIHLAADRGTAAVDALLEADLRAPGPALWLEMGLAHLAAGQPERARVYLSKLAGLEPGSCPALEGLALALEALGDVEGAEQARSGCADQLTADAGG